MLCSDMLHAEPMYDIGSDTVKVINLNLQTTAVLVYRIRFANLPIKCKRKKVCYSETYKNVSEDLI